MTETHNDKAPRTPVISSIAYTLDATYHRFYVKLENYQEGKVYKYRIRVSDDKEELKGESTFDTDGNGIWKLPKSHYMENTAHYLKVTLNYYDVVYESDIELVMAGPMKGIMVISDPDLTQVKYALPDYLQRLEKIQATFSLYENAFTIDCDTSNGDRVIRIPKSKIPLDDERDWKLSLSPYVSSITTGLTTDVIPIKNRCPVITQIKTIEVTDKSTNLLITTYNNCGNRKQVELFENCKSIDSVYFENYGNLNITFKKGLNAGACNSIAVRNGRHNYEFDSVGLPSLPKTVVLREPQIISVDSSNPDACIAEIALMPEAAVVTDVEVYVNGDAVPASVQDRHYLFSLGESENGFRIAAAQKNDIATGPVSQEVALLTSVPEIGKMESGGDSLTVTRAALPEGATGCNYLFYRNGSEILCRYSTSESISIQCTEMPDSAAVQAVDRMPGMTERIGPMSAPAEVVDWVPALQRIISDEKGVTYNWTGKEGCSYEYAANSTQSPVSTTECSCTIPGTPPENEPTWFYLRAIKGVSYGPWIRFPVEAYRVTIADYDGLTAEIAWTAPKYGGTAESFRVEILDTDGQVAFTATTCEMAASIPLKLRGGSVRVVPLYGGTEGLQSGVLPLYSNAIYIGRESGIDAARYLPMECSQAQRGALTLEIRLHSAPGACGNDMFALEAPEGGGYSLTMQPAVWDFSQTGRDTVKRCYRDFMAQLEKSGAGAGDFIQLQNLLGRVLPQALSETLFYNFGFDEDTGCVDLRPGMSIRVEYESRQEALDIRKGSFKEGYLALGQTEYEIAADTSDPACLITGIDAFMANIAGKCMEIKNPGAHNQAKQGAGGLTDLNAPKMRKSYYRLVLPNDCFGQAEDGESRYYWYPTLLASDSYEELGNATKQLRGYRDMTSDKVEGMYIMGRASIVPCIKVFLDGEHISVPVGTSLAQALSWKGLLTPMTGEGEDIFRAIRFRRHICCESICGRALPGFEKSGVLLDYWDTNRESAAWPALLLLQGDEIWTR